MRTNDNLKDRREQNRIKKSGYFVIIKVRNANGEESNNPFASDLDERAFYSVEDAKAFLQQEKFDSHFYEFSFEFVQHGDIAQQKVFKQAMRTHAKTFFPQVFSDSVIGVFVIAIILSIIILVDYDSLIKIFESFEIVLGVVLGIALFNIARFFVGAFRRAKNMRNTEILEWENLKRLYSSHVGYEVSIAGEGNLDTKENDKEQV